MSPLLVLLVVAVLSALFRAWLVNNGKALYYNTAFHLVFGIIGPFLFYAFNPEVLVMPVFIGVVFGYGVPAFFESFMDIFGWAEWK